MGDISVIEWIVYGLVGYSSVLMLIVSTIKDVPITKSLSGLRAIFLVPGVICNGILATASVHVVLQNVNTITKNLNDTSTWSEVVTTNIPLQDPAWQTVHYMFMIILVVFILVQIFNAIGKTE